MKINNTKIVPINKIKERLNALETILNVMEDDTISASDINNMTTDIRRGAMIFAAIQFERDDLDRTILRNIQLNHVMSDVEIEINDKYNRYINRIIELVKRCELFTEQYIEATQIRLYTLYDWLLSFKNNYFYFDSMISSTMVDKYNGFFDAKTRTFKFGNYETYNNLISNSFIRAELKNKNVKIKDFNSELFIIEQSLKTPTLELHITVSSNNFYGIAIRSNKYFDSENNLNIKHLDKYPYIGQQRVTIVLNGIKEGNLYMFNYVISASLFFEVNSGYYLTKPIEFDGYKSKIYLETFFSPTYVQAVHEIISEYGVSSRKIMITKDKSFIDDLSRTTPYNKEVKDMSDIDGYKMSETGLMSYSFKDSLLSSKTLESDVKLGDIYVGLNCVVNTKETITTIEEIAIDGEYVYDLADLLKPYIEETAINKKKMNLTVWLKLQANLTNIVNDEGKEYNIFSVYGKPIFQYLYDNNKQLNEVGSLELLEDSSGLVDCYFSEFQKDPGTDSSLGKTVYYMLSGVSVDKITFKMDYNDLLKYYKTTETFMINSTISIENYNLFSSETQRSLFYINNSGIFPNEEGEGGSVPRARELIDKIVEDETLTSVSISFNIVLRRINEMKKYKMTIKALKDTILEYPIKSSTEALNNYGIYNSRGFPASKESMKKDNIIVLEIHAMDEFIRSYFVEMTKNPDILIYSGKKLEYDHVGNDSSKYHVREGYFVFNYDLSRMISEINPGVLALININVETKIAGLYIEYQEYVANKKNIHMIKLTSKFTGYPVNQLGVYNA